MTNESMGVERDVGMGMMKEEGVVWLTIAKRKQRCVGMICQHGAECIVTTDDGNGCRYEGRFGEGDDEVNSP